MLQTNLMFDPKLFQDRCERRRQVHPGMRLRNLNDVKEKNQWDTSVFKMYSHRYIGAVVRRRPSVRCETQLAFVFLEVRQTEHWSSCLGMN